MRGARLGRLKCVLEGGRERERMRSGKGGRQAVLNSLAYGADWSELAENWIREREGGRERVVLC